MHFLLLSLIKDNIRWFCRISRNFWHNTRSANTHQDEGNRRRWNNPKGRKGGIQARANFNNGDFQAVINEFAEYVLLKMIMESEKSGGWEWGRKQISRKAWDGVGWMKRSWIVIIHPTSSVRRGKCGAIQIESEIFYCAESDNRFMLFCVSLASYNHIAICMRIGICQYAVQCQSLTRLGAVASRARIARE